MYCYAGELHVLAVNTRSSGWQRSTIDCARIDPHRILIARLSNTGVATDKHGIFASSNDDCFWPKSAAPDSGPWGRLLVRSRRSRQWPGRAARAWTHFGLWSDNSTEAAASAWTA